MSSDTVSPMRASSCRRASASAVVSSMPASSASTARRSRPMSALISACSATTSSVRPSPSGAPQDMRARAIDETTIADSTAIMALALVIVILLPRAMDATAPSG